MRQFAIKIFAPGISVLAVGSAVAVYLAAPAILEPSWIKQARAIHAEWMTEGAVSGARRIDGPTYLSDIRMLGPTPRIPDLTGGFLALERIVHIPASGSRPEALHAGYVERHGCRLSLWMSPSKAGDEAAARDGAYAWATGGLRYAIVADGFPEARLEVIGMLVRRMAAEERGLHAHERQSLSLGAALNPTCRP